MLALFSWVLKPAAATSMLLHPISFIISAVVVVVVVVVIVVKWSHNIHPNSPPSPPRLPIIGNLLSLGSQPHINLQTLAQRYGPLMLLQLGSKPVLVVSSADAARDIMKTHDLNFSNRPKSVMFAKLFYNYNDVVVAPYGDYWRQVRSICMLQLLSNKKVKSFDYVRKEETSLMIRKIKEEYSNCAVNLSELIAGLTNDVLCRIALGKKYREEEEDGKFKPLIDELGELLGAFCIRDYIPWLGWLDQIMFGLDDKADKVAKALDVFLNKVIEEHSSNTTVEEEEDDGNQKDFVDVLVSMMRDNNYSIGSLSLDRTCVKAVILDMFAAGSETTYTALEWAMAELLRNPKVMKKMKDEMKKIVSNKKTDISEEDLAKMHYMKAVIKETLRLHPPLPLLVPRESIQRVEVKGYNIPAGTRVIINAWAIGRDQDFWEEAEEFKPERFLNNDIDFNGRESFHLIPFGGGRRGCPGIAFSMALMELVLANLVLHFDWSLPGGAQAEDLDMTGSFGISVHKKLPLVASPTVVP